MKNLFRIATFSVAGLIMGLSWPVRHPVKVTKTVSYPVRHPVKTAKYLLPPFVF